METGSPSLCGVTPGIWAADWGVGSQSVALPRALAAMVADLGSSLFCADSSGACPCCLSALSHLRALSLSPLAVGRVGCGVGGRSADVATHGAQRGRPWLCCQWWSGFAGRTHRQGSGRQPWASSVPNSLRLSESLHWEADLVGLVLCPLGASSLLVHLLIGDGQFRFMCQ